MNYARIINSVNRLDYAPGGRSRTRQHNANKRLAQQMFRRDYRRRRIAAGLQGG